MNTLRLALVLTMFAATACDENMNSATDSETESDSSLVNSTDSEACTVYVAPGDTDTSGNGSTAETAVSNVDDALDRAETLEARCGDNVEVRILEGSASDSQIAATESDLRNSGYRVTRVNDSASNTGSQNSISGSVSLDSPSGVNSAFNGSNVFNQAGAMPLAAAAPYWLISTTDSNSIVYPTGTVSITDADNTSVGSILQLQGGNDTGCTWSTGTPPAITGTPVGQLNLRSSNNANHLFMDNNEIDTFTYTAATATTPEKWTGLTLNINGNSRANVNICKSGGSVGVGGSPVSGNKMLIQGTTDISYTDTTVGTTTTRTITNGTLRVKDTSATNALVMDSNQIEGIGGLYFNHYAKTNITIGGGGGKVIIGGISNSSYTQKLIVDGGIRAEELLLDNVTGADFVFEENYNLMCIDEVEKFVEENNHLPGIASAADMQQNGVSMGEFQIQLLQKIEELTLYMIEQNKLNKEQSTRIKDLEQKCGQ